MPKGRLVFDGDNIYTEKDARIYKLKSSVSSKIDEIPGVVDSLDSVSSTDALSANMGRELLDKINALSGTGKFLSTWDCTTGLPTSNPAEDPYTYKTGDYYVVSVVGATNYKPHGGTYTQGVPSTTVEIETVGINDKYYFDGADWVRIPDTSIQITIDTALDTSSTNAVENRAIANAINTKQATISDLNDIRTGAGKGATALQPNDNITQLTNNAGYQTAGDVASAIQGVSADINTKTFYLAGTTGQANLAVAQAAYEWHNAGKNAVIIYTPERGTSGLTNSGNTGEYLYLYDSGSGIVFVATTDVEQSSSQGVGGRSLNKSLMELTISGGQVTGITKTNSVVVADFLSTSKTNHPFTPSDNYHPATKKYVDDAAASATASGATTTQPSNPSAGAIYYDTVNNVLKVYNGSEWVEVGEGAIYTAGTGINIDANNEISNTGVLSSNSTYNNVIHLSQTDYDNLQTKDPNTLYSTPDEGETIMSDAAYDATTWDGDTTHVPTKNAVRDKIYAMDTTISGITSVPSGGTDGQVLTKVSGSPAWANAPATGIQKSSTSPMNVQYIWGGTQSQYNNLQSYDANTIYLTV